MRILIIEDDPDILSNIAHHFESHGHIVDYASEGRQGYALAAAGGFDLIVLDLMLPRLDGYEVCRRLRDEAASQTPIIMVTARDTLDERLAGFDVGADDYLVKPFALAELSARAQALFQRSRRNQQGRTLQVADLAFDLDTRELRRDGKLLHLPPVPLQLLVALMQASPAVVHRVRLEEMVWHDSPPDSDSLRTHIHRIRQVIDKAYPQSLLHTIHGIGYQLRAADD